MLASWRKSGLVKRLWKQRRHETISKDEVEQDIDIRSALHSLLKRLGESELEHLLQCVETKGGEATPCIQLKLVKLGARMLDPRTLLCGMFRWPHILEDGRTFEAEERIEWCCHCSEDEVDVCCNPYHHTIVLTPQFQTIRTRVVSTDDEKDVIDTTYSAPSTETGGTPSYQLPVTGDSLTPDGNHRNYWCVIAYWEHRRRLGRLFTVQTPSINVFQQLPHGDGVSLNLLQTEPPENDNVKRTREKIGLGLLLSRKDEEVWIYNRSEYPIFVNTPPLDNPDTRTFSVHKLNSGYSMKVFDFSEPLRKVKDPSDGPYDPCAIRISFAKGWGGQYSRQFVTSCPCWLEILLRKTGS